MESNLYTLTVPVMMKSIEAFIKILDKASAHAASKATARRPAAYFETALLSDRIIFDQFPLGMQIQRVSDNGKNGAARLAGVEAPAMEDIETTFAELKTRLEKTLEFIDTVKPEDIIGHEDRQVVLPYWGGKHLTGFEYATEYMLPNFFFHYVTAYSILRKNGIDIGKEDFIGGLPLK